jgi:copper chaperone CopZ
MREQVRTCEGEEDNVEQAIGKVDAVEKNSNTKWDIMVRKSAIACD